MSGPFPLLFLSHPHILQMLPPNGFSVSAGCKNCVLHVYINFLHCLVKEEGLPSCLGI